MFNPAKIYRRKESVIPARPNEWWVYGAFFVLYILYTYLFADKLALRLGGSGYQTSFANSDGWYVASALVIAPIVEELIFRTHLSGLKKHYWAFVLPLIALALTFNEYLLWIGLGAGLILIAGVLDRKYNPGPAAVNSPLFYGMFVLTGIIFALVHTDLAEAQSLQNALIITMVSYLPLSFFLGYIRYKKNLMYAMLFHALSNLTMLTINGIIY